MASRRARCDVRSAEERARTGPTLSSFARRRAASPDGVGSCPPRRARASNGERAHPLASPRIRRRGCVSDGARRAFRRRAGSPAADARRFSLSGVAFRGACSSGQPGERSPSASCFAVGRAAWPAARHALADAEPVQARRRRCASLTSRDIGGWARWSAETPPRRHEGSSCGQVCRFARGGERLASGEPQQAWKRRPFRGFPLSSAAAGAKARRCRFAQSCPVLRCTALVRAFLSRLGRFRRGSSSVVAALRLFSRLASLPFALARGFTAPRLASGLSRRRGASPVATPPGAPTRGFARSSVALAAAVHVRGRGVTKKKCSGVNRFSSLRTHINEG